MPSLALNLQEAFANNCPPGWVCRSEARVVPAEMERGLRYEPQADVRLQEAHVAGQG